MLFLGANPRNLRPLSAQQILANTPPQIVDYSGGCNVAPLKQGEDWQAPAQFRKLSALGPVYLEMYRAQCRRMYEDSKKPLIGPARRVIVCWAGMPEPGLSPEDIAPGRPGMDTPVWVSCNCNFFRYVCEWALTRYGSSDIIVSNGRAAVQTNPSGIGLGCKHVYAALQYSMRHWSAEPPETQAVEEPEIEPTPQVPDVQPQEEPPPALQPEPQVQQQAPTDEGAVEERPPLRGASFHLSQRLRAVALPFEQECC